ncbi:MAG: sensor histidine kinase [Lachnospiraceae bacterium]|nr:sensor histidine kinase [Lachnospiraceae bacterium]
MYYKIGYELAVILIVGILHTGLLKKIMDTFLLTEDRNKLISKMGFVGYYLLTTAAYSVFHVSHLYELCNLVGIIGVTCFYRAAWEKKMWISMVFFCMDTGSGIAVSFAGAEMIRMQQSAISALLLLICVVIVCHIPDPKENREKALDKKQMFLLSAIPMLSVAVFCRLMYGSIDRLTAVFVCVVVMTLNLCVFYLYHIMLRNYVQLREQDIYKQQTIAYQNQFELMKESQSRIRALRHDMKNHVLALEGLAKGSKPEKLIEYLASMQEFMQNPSEHIYTGNEALDSLLNYKLQRAHEELKRLETDIVLPEKMKLRSFDFNVIVGNLLDNAVAASIQTDEQFLRLSMRMENGILFLYMVNSCLGIPEGVCDIRKLSEKSSAEHGIGLTNVQKIVEKYHGDMEMHCKDNYMKTEIMLYMKNL